jgi:tetratricopeptide (TPR) repeat protein
MHTRWSAFVLCFAILNCTPLHAQSSVPALNEAGWKMIQQNEPARAVSLFAQALVLRPDDPVLLFGAGVAANLDGRPSDAKTKLLRVLDLNPRFTSASLLLGEIVYREGDVDRSIKIYEAALVFAPGDRDLHGKLREWRGESAVHSTFVERQQGRFSVMFEGRTDSALAERASQLLETAFSRIAKQLRALPPDPIAVILYTDKQFRDITRAPAWSGGLYDGRIRIPVGGAARTPALFDVVLVHELTHAMVVIDRGERRSHVAARGARATLFRCGSGGRETTTRERRDVHCVRGPGAQLRRFQWGRRGDRVRREPGRGPQPGEASEPQLGTNPVCTGGDRHSQ